MLYVSEPWRETRYLYSSDRASLERPFADLSNDPETLPIPTPRTRAIAGHEHIFEKIAGRPQSGNWSTAGEQCGAKEKSTLFDDGVFKIEHSALRGSGSKGLS